MKNTFNYILLFIFLLSFSSCTIHTKTNYTNIPKLEKEGYQIIYQEKPVNFSNYFFDRENVKYVLKKRKEKIVNIVPVDSNSEFINGSDFLKQADKENICELVVINGIPYSIENMSEVEIEVSSIKSLDILKSEKSSLSHLQKDVLIIVTK